MHNGSQRNHIYQPQMEAHKKKLIENWLDEIGFTPISHRVCGFTFLFLSDFVMRATELHLKIRSFTRSGFV